MVTFRLSPGGAGLSDSWSHTCTSSDQASTLKIAVCPQWRDRIAALSTVESGPLIHMWAASPARCSTSIFSMLLCRPKLSCSCWGKLEANSSKLMLHPALSWYRLRFSRLARRECGLSPETSYCCLISSCLAAKGLKCTVEPQSYGHLGIGGCP